jgi:aspartyl protease family protein
METLTARTPRRSGAPAVVPVRAVPARLAALALSACLFAAPASAQDVALAGRMGERALLLVAGQTKVVAVGQTVGNTKLLRWEADTAVVEQGGVQFKLRVGGAPVRFGATAATSAGARTIVIPVGAGGHFVTTGSINGQATRFMVDTGATLVSMSLDEARRLGLELRDAQRVLTQTAGGTVQALRVTLNQLRVGEVETYNVDALVTAAPMPFILLGNSFLQRFSMRREADLMRLELR